MSSIGSVTVVSSTLASTSLDNVFSSASADIEALEAKKKQIEA